MVSIGIFNISFRLLAIILRLSTLLWCGLLAVEFQWRIPAQRRDVVTPQKVQEQPPQWSDSHILYFGTWNDIEQYKKGKNLKILKFIFWIISGGCLKIEVMKPPIKARRLNLSIWEPSAEDAHSKFTVGGVLEWFSVAQHHASLSSEKNWTENHQNIKVCIPRILSHAFARGNANSTAWWSIICSLTSLNACSHMV